MKLTKKIPHRLALAVAICMPLFVATPASAHKQFLVPTSTIVNGKAPLVSVDAAAATNVFEFDHVGISVNNLVITAADGSLIKSENNFSGKLRNSFDVRLSLPGTYKISLVNEGLSATYKENGEAKRWRGSAEALAKEVPANATNLEVTQNFGRIETFVTNGKPNTNSLKLTGKGIELNPITHPNDLVDGEPAQFQVMLDGKALAGTKVTVIAGGIRYRHKLDEQTYTTDQDGKFTVTWQGAGMYWINASHTDKQSNMPNVKERRANYAATLEVLPQ